MDEKKILKYAIDYLSKYSSSKKNLLDVLKRKIFRQKIDKLQKYKLINSLEKIVIKLEQNNLINDNNFSSLKINSLSKVGKSKRFIINYLIKKGINKNQISNDLEEFQLNNTDWELKSAELFAKKKNLHNSKDTYEKKLAKMARAGFSFEICKKILN